MSNDQKLQWSRVSGFTLLEMMITVALLAIILSLATPSFASVINGGRLAAAANELLATMQTARSEAIRRNARVVVCASSNGTACSDSSTWSTGWIAFHDTDRDGIVDTGESVLRKSDSVEPLQVLSSSNLGSKVTFRADGLARAGNGALLAGRFAVCSTESGLTENVRDVGIATGARVNVSRRNASGSCATPSN